MPSASPLSVRLNDLVVDVSLSGVAQGDVLYRGASKWNNLSAGTSGYFLKSNGPGANPEWAAATASPGGSSGQLQYNNAGALGGLASTAVATSGSLITVTAPAATDIPLTLVGHASQTADLQIWKVGSTTIARLSPTTLFVKDGSVSAPGWAFVGQPSLGMFRITGTDIGLCYGSSQYVKMGVSGVIVAAGVGFYITSTAANAGAGVECGFVRSASGIGKVVRNDSNNVGALICGQPTTSTVGMQIQLASGTPTVDALQVTLSDGTTELLDIGASGILGAYNGLKLYSNANVGAILQDGTNFGLVFISTNTANPTMWLADNSLRFRSDIPIGWSSSSSTAVAGRDTGIARDAAGKVVLTDGSTGAGSLVLRDAGNIETGTTTGTKIGTATTQKIGFWNATPVVQQVLATGAGASVDDVITFLQTIGLCKQS